MSNMKFVKVFSIVLLSMISVFAVSQKPPQPQPEDVPDRMMRIPGKAFLMGTNSQASLFGQPDNNVMVTVSPFFMDQYEVSNWDYRQFVNWVRDSIAMQLIIDNDPDSKFAKKDPNTDEVLGIEWKNRGVLEKEIYSKRKSDEEIADVLAPLFYDEGRGDLNTNMLHYRYSWKNTDQMRYRKGASNNQVVKVDSFWVEIDEETGIATGNVLSETYEYKANDPKSRMTNCIVAIYPDTLVWVRDFPNSRTDLEHNYFSNPSFANYPVVGVTWEQAHAYCDWRTKMEEDKNGKRISPYRLPTEAEWEFAARGGIRMAAYPWGDNSRLANGKHMANAKYSRGIYMEDKGAVTREVTAYDPNKYKLYNMAGNVAEWTASAYSSSANSKTHDFNPDFSYMAKKSDPKGLRRKVVKGGSWKDISYFLQCGVRTYEYQDEARSYIGFRCVRSCVTLTVTDEEANQ